MDISQLIACIIGPRLFRVHRSGSIPGRIYKGNAAETIGDNAIRLVYLTWSLGIYTTPIVVSYLYQRGTFTMANGAPGPWGTALRTIGAILTVFGGGYLLRGLGRLANTDYLGFLAHYNQARQLTPAEFRERKSELASRYDFDFTGWPIEYRWSDSKLGNQKPPTPLPGRNDRSHSLFAKFYQVPMDIISYVAVYSFGRRMMYPGSVWILQRALDPMLLDGRTRLVEKYNGERFKLEAYDKNTIDTMFVDRRRSSHEKGRTLVICSEGNAGFYEIGIMATPLEVGYSVLGWNHPGFAHSTGIPFPAAEVSAIDTVLKFSIEKLGFKPENIILYAWSIGGYPCSWAAMQYPDIRGAILDATFDDIVPLAVAKMPPSWRPLVVNTVKNYFNLNISENLNYYNGPVQFVRRLQDEMIYTVDSEPIKTNRANDLLTKLLRNRFPHLMDAEDAQWSLMDWLAGDREHQHQVARQHGVNEELCLATLASYVEANEPGYPIKIGQDLTDDVKVQLVIFLASKHLIDYDSTHCTPLPKQLFHEPWDLFKETATVPRSNL